MRMMGHGLEPVLYERQIPDVLFGGNTQAVVSPGGAGMQVCRENLTLDTVGYFKAWAGKVKRIDMLGCGIAYITPGC